MVRYSDELIEEIRTNNDIVDVISKYVTLKRSGRNFFGLCPFHKEKSPSFAVSPDKQIFHCFGCGAGGNVIHFISKIEGLDFKDTLELLANRANIELPTLENSEDDKTARLKSKVYEIITPSGRRILPPGECFLERKRIRRLARRQGRADDTRPDTERAGVGTHTEIPGHADKNAPCAPQRQRIPRYYTRRLSLIHI